MAHMVKPVHGIAERDEVVDHVHVAAAVFAKPVDDEQHGFDVPSRKPGLMIDVGIPHALEIAFSMLHRISYFRLLWKYLMVRPSGRRLALQALTCDALHLSLCSNSHL